MDDYSAWPTRANVQSLLTAAGITPSTAVAARYDALIKAIVAEVARETRREFIVATNETRRFDGSGTPVLEIDPLLELTSIAVLDSHGDPISALNAQLSKSKDRLYSNAGGAPAFASSFPPGRENIAITGTWGHAEAIPADLWDAVANRVAASMALLQFSSAGTDDSGRQIIEEQFGDEKKKYSAADYSQSGPFTHTHARDWKDLLKRYRRRNGAAPVRGEMID